MGFKFFNYKAFSVLSPRPQLASLRIRFCAFDVRAALFLCRMVVGRRSGMVRSRRLMNTKCHIFSLCIQLFSVQPQQLPANEFAMVFVE